MNDILGTALLDYQNGVYTEDVVTFSSLGEEDRIPLPHFFRNFQAMPELEQQALRRCRGSVLDIGCGAGSHSLYLQKKGLNVTALDHSKGAIETCRLRGIDRTVQADITDYQGERFDTLLLLMNGIGIVGSLENLTEALHHWKTLLKPNGQIVLDSTDIIYMYDEEERPNEMVPYYGEVTFRFQYKGVLGPPFPWLYVAYPKLEEAANACDLSCEFVREGPHYDYLAILRPTKY